MAHVLHDVGIARQIGAYSDAVEAGANLDWLLTSATPGISADGACPGDIASQAALAWEHITLMLENAGMTVADIVKVTQYLTRPEDISSYTEMRGRFLGDAQPASTLLVVSRLVRPEFLVEVEIIAARAKHGGQDGEADGTFPPIETEPTSGE